MLNWISCGRLLKQEIQTLLRFLFGDNLSKTFRGILIDQTDDGEGLVTMKGRFKFGYLIDDRWYPASTENMNKLKRYLNKYAAAQDHIADLKLQAAMHEDLERLKAAMQELNTDGDDDDSESEADDDGDDNSPSFVLSSNTWVGMVVPFEVLLIEA